MNIRVAAESNCQHGEGIICDDSTGSLFWVDIVGKQLFAIQKDNEKLHKYPMPEQIGFVVLDRPGFLIAGMEQGLARVKLATNSIQWLGGPEPHLPNNRFNDGKRDRQGRIWANTMDIDAAADRGSLYCCVINDNNEVTFTQHDTGFTIGNGPTWSLDYKTFYHTETRRGTIFAYDFDEKNGTISNKREFYVHQEEGVRPDGMCTDNENHLWVALAHGGRVIRLTPEGKFDCEIGVGTSFPTSATLAGDDRNELYITTSKNVSGKNERVNTLSGQLLCTNIKTTVRCR